MMLVLPAVAQEQKLEPNLVLDRQKVLKEMPTRLEGYIKDKRRGGLYLVQIKWHDRTISDGMPLFEGRISWHRRGRNVRKTEFFMKIDDIGGSAVFTDRRATGGPDFEGPHQMTGSVDSENWAISGDLSVASDERRFRFSPAGQVRWGEPLTEDQAIRTLIVDFDINEWMSAVYAAGNRVTLDRTRSPETDCFDQGCSWCFDLFESLPTHRTRYGGYCVHAYSHVLSEHIQ